MKYLIMSLIFHYLIFNSFIPEPESQGKGGPPSDGSKKKDKATELVNLKVIEKAKKGKKLKCDTYYIGIGFKHDNVGVVTEVFKGYEAERLKVKVGDWILNISDCRGKEGESFLLVGERDGKVFRKKATRVKICEQK